MATWNYTRFAARPQACGRAGLTTAYLLQKEGKSVVVVDVWGLVTGETDRTAAHLTAVPDDCFSNLNRSLERTTH